MKNKVVLTGVLFLGFVFGGPVFAQTATDTTPPSDIEKAPTVISVGNQRVTLSWDVGIDNVGVTGYKIYYGTKSLVEQRDSNSNEKSEYDAFVTVGDVNQTDITGLTNDTKYYFSVTALDAAGNESEFYSPEAEATATADTGSVVNTNTNDVVPEVNENANTPVLAENTNDNSGAEVTMTGSVLPTLADVTHLVATFQRVLEKYTVTLRWAFPQDVTNIVSQIVYKSLDGTVFNQLGSLAPTVNMYEVTDLNPGKYFFKVTTKDKEGNESKGVIQVVQLPATGPAIILFSLAALGTGIVLKRKKQ